MPFLISFKLRDDSCVNSLIFAPFMSVFVYVGSMSSDNIIKFNKKKPLSATRALRVPY